MAQKTITVRYVNGAIDVPNITITEQGKNVIKWVAGTGILSIDSITGLPSPPFSMPQKLNKGFKVTDTNNNTTTTPNSYNYTIGYTLSRSKASGRHDPQITNEPT